MATNPYAPLGDRIDAFRLSLVPVPSLDDLAKATGIPRPTLTRKIRNGDLLTLAEFRALSAALDVDPALWLSEGVAAGGGFCLRDREELRSSRPYWRGTRRPVVRSCGIYARRAYPTSASQASSSHTQQLRLKRGGWDWTQHRPWDQRYGPCHDYRSPPPAAEIA